MKAMIKVGRWANEHKHAAGAILNRQTFYLDAEDTYEGIKHVDMVPSLSAQNLQCIKIGKDFMLSHGYIKNDFDVDAWAAPEFLEQAAVEVLKEEWQKRSWSKLPQGGGLEVEGAGGSGSGAGSQALGSPGMIAVRVHHPRRPKELDNVRPSPGIRPDRVCGRQTDRQNRPRAAGSGGARHRALCRHRLHPQRRDGSTRTIELNDLDPEGYEMFAPMGEHVSSLFTNDDLEIAASKLPAGSAALLILWENLWVADLRTAIVEAGGELVERVQITAEVVEEFEQGLAAE